MVLGCSQHQQGPRAVVNKGSAQQKLLRWESPPPLRLFCTFAGPLTALASPTPKWEVVIVVTVQGSSDRNSAVRQCTDQILEAIAFAMWFLRCVAVVVLVVSPACAMHASECAACVAPVKADLPFCGAVVNYSKTCLPSGQTMKQLDGYAKSSYMAFAKKWFNGKAPKKCQADATAFSCYSFFTGTDRPLLLGRS
jgi:hypothetical protein